MSLLDCRIHSLQRRADSLPKEIDQWLRGAEAGGQFEKNYSQLQALDLFMHQIIQRLEQVTSELNRLAPLTPSNTVETLHQAQVVEEGIFKANYIWGYFRSKLEQRFIPQFAQSLFLADLVSYDCYRTVMNNATTLGIQHKLGLRDYPLTYLLEDYSSPVTWPRKVELARLDYRMLPVPIIGVPWDHTANPWELLSLHHEVSHDIDIDLNEPSQELGIYLEQKMIEKGIPQKKAAVWRGWMSEIFADFLGILLAGPPFVSFLAGFMTLPANVVSGLVPDDPHPIPYLRTLLNGEFIRCISPGNDAQTYISNLLAQWKGIYGEPSPDMAVYSGDFNIVIETILTTKLDALVDKNGTRHSLQEFAGFDEEDFKKQLNACDYFLSDKEISTDIPIRHIIGAAYMAVEKQTFDDNFASRVLGQLNRAVEAKAPKGQLALRSKQSDQYLKNLADSYFDSKLNLNGGFYGQAIC